MIQYILECIAFQLIFLLIYDLFLKKETFFQWNRVYLMVTYILSLALPWIKIEAFATKLPEAYNVYPEFLWNIDQTAIKPFIGSDEPLLSISTEYVILLMGMAIASMLFAYKLFRIYKLRREGDLRYFKNFTRVIVQRSNVAFSFFKTIFLGDQVLTKEHQSIIEHELVHIKQLHSFDLLFFELMRVLCWFNPLVYSYQSKFLNYTSLLPIQKLQKIIEKNSINCCYHRFLIRIISPLSINFLRNH